MVREPVFWQKAILFFCLNENQYPQSENTTEYFTEVTAGTDPSVVVSLLYLVRNSQQAVSTMLNTSVIAVCNLGAMFFNISFLVQPVPQTFFDLSFFLFIC